MSSSQKVFLITGCSAGLGYSLSKAVLTARHKLVATSRNPSKTPEIVDEIKKLGGQWIKLDVTSPTLDSEFQEAVNVYGRVDVLINNAGVALGGSVEDTDLNTVKTMFETNFFSMVRLTQQATPIMRAQGGGAIVNIASGSSVNPVPGISLYGASKAAVECFTEAFRQEVAGFNIRVLLAHPGGINNGFISHSPFSELSEAYKGTVVEGVLNFMSQATFTIDPAKLAERIVEVVDNSGTMEPFAGKDYFRIPFGEEMVQGFTKRAETLKTTAQEFEGVARSVEGSA